MSYFFCSGIGFLANEPFRSRFNPAERGSGGASRIETPNGLSAGAIVPAADRNVNAIFTRLSNPKIDPIAR